MMVIYTNISDKDIANYVFKQKIDGNTRKSKDKWQMGRSSFDDEALENSKITNFQHKWSMIK